MGENVLPFMIFFLDNLSKNCWAGGWQSWCMGLLKSQDKIYCKKPLDKFETGNFQFHFADDLETTLNMKDVKKK